MFEPRPGRRRFGFRKLRVIRLASLTPQNRATSRAWRADRRRAFAPNNSQLKCGIQRSHAQPKTRHRLLMNTVNVYIEDIILAKIVERNWSDGQTAPPIGSAPHGTRSMMRRNAVIASPVCAAGAAGRRPVMPRAAAGAPGARPNAQEKRRRMQEAASVTPGGARGGFVQTAAHHPRARPGVPRAPAGPGRVRASIAVCRFCHLDSRSSRSPWKIPC